MWRAQRPLREFPRAELLRRTLDLLGRERHPLTHLNGRRTVIQSDENDFHAASTRS